MASEDAPSQSIGDRLVAYFSRVHEGYDRVAGRVRNYTPYVVRVAEVVLAIALLAALGHWIYWVYF